MKKQDFLNKVQSMLPDLNEMIMERAVKAFDSGAVDTESFEDNFILPKIFMSAMGEEIKFQYKPHDKKNIKVRDNLSLFL